MQTIPNKHSYYPNSLFFVRKTVLLVQTHMVAISTTFLFCPFKKGFSSLNNPLFVKSQK